MTFCYCISINGEKSMKRLVLLVLMLCLFVISPLEASDRRDFDTRTLSDFVTESASLFRAFGANNLKQSATTLFIRNQIIPKHGSDMYTLWSHANNWENAGKSDLRYTAPEFKIG
jgi:hypothetical protein